eukprot:CAMPEP_0170645960 /NCGR_PEP_ID=MMETSP0224-20130122/43372_1 /TAXON_ID=285029 /ORGANISM="Togula jolla, Strain CCCM 725" /LENGTH=164 /DNA_ID=CAMNT_0010977239 /DNA_START=151 /DNA_END=646 /DNA_ORIENTATION=+
MLLRGTQSSIDPGPPRAMQTRGCRQSGPPFACTLVEGVKSKPSEEEAQSEAEVCNTRIQRQGGCFETSRSRLEQHDGKRKVPPATHHHVEESEGERPHFVRHAQSHIPSEEKRQHQELSERGQGHRQEEHTLVAPRPKEALGCEIAAHSTQDGHSGKAGHVEEG